jgi:GNAT superfamily N-acetyltransferase
VQSEPPPGGQQDPGFLKKVVGMLDAGAALVSGVTNYIPGAVAGGLGASLAAITEGVQGRTPLAKPNEPASFMNRFGGVVGSVAQGALEGARRASHEPSTPEGQGYVEDVSRSGAMQSLNALGASGPMSAVKGELKPIPGTGTMARGVVRNAAAEVLPGTVRNAEEAGAARQKAARLAAPENQGTLDALQAGYKLTQKAARGGGIAQAVETAAGRPQAAKELAAHNTETTARLARQDIGLPEDVPVTQENVQKVRQEAGKAYAFVQDVGKFRNDAQYKADLDRILKPHETVAEGYPASKAMDNPIIDRIKALRVDETSTAAAVEQVKFLRDEADQAARGGSKKLAADYRNAAQAVDNAMDRALGEMAGQGADPALAQAVGSYRDARRLIAKSYLLEDAMTGKPGEVNAMAYARALEKGAKLDGPALQIANFGKQFGGEGLAKSRSETGGIGPHGLDLMLAALSHPGGALASLASLGTRPLARAMLGSKRAQERLARRARAALPEGRGGVEQAVEAPQPPEITTSPGAAPEGAPAPPAPPAGPLGDLTPDWTTQPGVAAAAPVPGLEPTGLVRALGEEMPSTGSRASTTRNLDIPAVAGRPDLPDTMVVGDPAEVAGTQAASEAMLTPEAALARRQQGYDAGHIPVGEVIEGMPEMPPEPSGPVERIPIGRATELATSPVPKVTTPKRIPVGTVIENAPEAPPGPVERIPTGEATEITQSGVEPIDVPPVGEAKELYVDPERLQAWRGKHKFGAEDERRAMDAAKALALDPAAVKAASKKSNPVAFDKEIARIIAQGESHASKSGPPAGGGGGAASPPATKAKAKAKAKGGSSPAAKDTPEPVAGTPAEPAPEPAAGSGAGAAAEPGGKAAGVVEKVGDVEIREKPDGTGFVAVTSKGEVIGRLNDNLKPGQAKMLDEHANVSDVSVEKAHRGVGIGRALYRAFEAKHEGRILPSGQTTIQAWKVWKRNYPEKVDRFVEMEVKRVKDGADPGLVIRNITDPDVRGRVAEGVTEWMKKLD